MHIHIQCNAKKSMTGGGKVLKGLEMVMKKVSLMGMRMGLKFVIRRVDKWGTI